MYSFVLLVRAWSVAAMLQPSSNFNPKRKAAPVLSDNNAPVFLGQTPQAVCAGSSCSSTASTRRPSPARML